jgi:hypothetical protein
MSKSIHKVSFAALAGLALSFGAGGASADIIDLTLDVQNGAILCGGTTQCTGPFVDVTVNRTSSTTATITFTSLTNSGFLYLMGGAQAADVNVNAATFTVSTAPTGTSPANITGGTLTPHIGSQNADGFGSFNLTIDNSDGFSSAYKTITFGITDVSGQWASASSVLIGNNDGNLAAAHIFPCTITSAGCDLTNSPGANGSTGFAAVPIPAAAWLFGSGLIGLIGIARRKLAPTQARELNLA